MAEFLVVFFRLSANLHWNEAPLQSVFFFFLHALSEPLKDELGARDDSPNFESLSPNSHLTLSLSHNCSAGQPASGTLL